jgi:hypothetical protein
MLVRATAKENPTCIFFWHSVGWEDPTEGEGDSTSTLNEKPLYLRDAPMRLFGWLEEAKN